MAVAIADRDPTQREMERLRLILSTFQDGSGMLAVKNGMTLPGWRDLERAVADTFEGEAAESKAIFDVALRSPEVPGTWYGISCKMRRELDRVDRDGRVTLELSNSARAFWAHLAMKGLSQETYRARPSDVGAALLELVNEWHEDVSLAHGGRFDLTKGCYLALMWNRAGFYQLFQFSLALPAATSLTWHFPERQHGGIAAPGQRLCGNDGQGTLFEWYGESGGQLQYYPFASSARWTSQHFRLEPLLATIEHGLRGKAARYFPHLWAATSVRE